MRLRGKRVCDRRCTEVRTVSCRPADEWIYQEKKVGNCLNRYKCKRVKVRGQYVLGNCQLDRQIKCDPVEKIVPQPPEEKPEVVPQPEPTPDPEDRPNPTPVPEKPKPKPEPKPEPEPEKEEPEPVKEEEEEEKPEKPQKRPIQYIPVPIPPPPAPMDNSDLLLAAELAQIRQSLANLLPGLLAQMQQKKSCCAQRSPCCGAQLLHESGKPYKSLMRRLERRLRTLTRRQERRNAERRLFARQRQLTRRMGDELE
jgi:hypothetical protein